MELPQIENALVVMGWMPTPRLSPRRATAQVDAALADTRVVLINGARRRLRARPRPATRVGRLRAE
jgi:hypothetical protein